MKKSSGAKRRTKNKVVLCDRCKNEITKKDAVKQDGLMYCRSCFAKMVERE